MRRLHCCFVVEVLPGRAVRGPQSYPRSDTAEPAEEKAHGFGHAVWGGPFALVVDGADELEDEAFDELRVLFGEDLAGINDDVVREAGAWPRLAIRLVQLEQDGAVEMCALGSEETSWFSASRSSRLISWKVSTYEPFPCCTTTSVTSGGPGSFTRRPSSFRECAATQSSEALLNLRGREEVCEG